MKDTLRTLSSGAGLMAGMPLLDVVFGGRNPVFAPSPPIWKPLNSKLDATQVAAVRLALSAHDVALIHGPPGTASTLINPKTLCKPISIYDYMEDQVLNSTITWNILYNAQCTAAKLDSTTVSAVNLALSTVALIHGPASIAASLSNPKTFCKLSNILHYVFYIPVV